LHTEVTLENEGIPHMHGDTMKEHEGTLYLVATATAAATARVVESCSSCLDRNMLPAFSCADSIGVLVPFIPGTPCEMVIAFSR